MLAPMGLRLSEEKTRVCHIDEGFDFLGWRIQRRAWRGRTGKRAVYTYPSKKALASVIGQGAVADSPSEASNARRPAAPAQPGAAGLVQLLPSRRVHAHLQLRRPLRLLADRRLAAQATPRAEHGAPWSAATSPDGRSATAGSRCSGPSGSRSSATATGAPASRPHGRARQRTTRTSGMNPWRAGCAETRTSGSEGGPRKRTGRKAGTAPRSDPYQWDQTADGHNLKLLHVVDEFTREALAIDCQRSIDADRTVDRAGPAGRRAAHARRHSCAATTGRR